MHQIADAQRTCPHVIRGIAIDGHAADNSPDLDMIAIKWNSLLQTLQRVHTGRSGALIHQRPAHYQPIIQIEIKKGEIATRSHRVGHAIAMFESLKAKRDAVLPAAQSTP